MENGIRANPGLQALYAAGTTGTVTMSQLENGLDDEEEGLALDAAEDAARGAEPAE